MSANNCRRAGVLAGCLMALLLGTPASAYDYPFDDPFVATVVGTPADYQADLDVRVPLKRRSIEIFPDREVPDVFFYDKKLRYSYALQKGPAPLVFLIAGTGGSHDGTSNRNIGKALYKAGFHFVALSSPTHSNFIVSASSSHVPGHAFDDAADLYRVMETIWRKLEHKAEVTEFFLTGYSLGAFNTAFVMNIDQERQAFRFKRALMINSPMRLYSSISLLDRMLENIPGGEDNFGAFYQQLIDRFAEVYTRSDELNLSEDFLYKVYEIYQPPNERLAALIGTAFRLAAANMAFTSDVMTDFGYIKPSNVRLRKNTDLATYNHVAMRLGFTDFFHAYFYPYYKARNPALTRTSLIEEMSLATIEDFLRNADNIYVTHNADDLILEPGQIDFFRQVFGERATIYPNGGHLGNMTQRDYVAHMIEIFRP
ncbi:MAG: alpha/beta fold hydrolase [Gammaproteobacteria bacterium]